MKAKQQNVPTDGCSDVIFSDPPLGLVRLQIRTAAGHTMQVGPLASLAGARQLAEDLIDDPTTHVASVRVEHRNRRWKCAWSMTLAGLATPEESGQ